MPLCFGDEGWGTLGILESWGQWEYWIVTKIYTGPAGQNAGIFGLWPGFPYAVFFVNRTPAGIDFGGNGWTEFNFWSQTECRLRDLYGYGIESIDVPENTWITFILSVFKKNTDEYIQVNNPSSGTGGKLIVGGRAEWHVNRLPYSIGDEDVQTSELYIRQYRASPPPTCYVSDFKWYKFFSVVKPVGIYGLSVGQTYAGGTKFVGSIFDISIWAGIDKFFTDEDLAGFRRVQGYALNPTAENPERPALEVYWPLISDGDTGYKSGAQTGDLFCYTSGTAAIGDCYDWEDTEHGAYEPQPPPPREDNRGRIITPPRDAGIYTLKRTVYTRTPERSAEVNI